MNKGDAATYRQIFHSINNALLVTDASGAVTHMNRQAEKLLALTPERDMGRPVSHLLPPAGPLVMKTLETGEAGMGHHIIARKIDLIINITPFHLSGSIKGAVCLLQETGQFEKTAKNLDSYKQLNRQLDTIFSQSSDGLWVCDGTGKIININLASERLNGIKASEVIGENIEDLLERGFFDRSITREVLETGRQVSMMQYIKKTGKYLLATGTPAFDPDGSIYLVVVNERDMTQLNALQEKVDRTEMERTRIKDELVKVCMLELREHGIVAESKGMRKTLNTALKLAHIGASNILILGESGTGKGLLSKFIHKSRKENRPFIQINCAALPENLLEAELFGYEKGAFTGAREEGKAGLFELAHKGTLFLDEIGDLPLSLQAKLLICLDNWEIMRLGGVKPRKIDCTVIAATNRNLDSFVKEKRFRRDLYYRLNVFTVAIPPLRERPDDIFELTRLFLGKYNKAYGMKKRIHPAALKLLQSYAFPGNVRELKNIIKKAVVMSEKNNLDEFIAMSIDAGAPAAGDLSPAETPGKTLTDKLFHLEGELLKNAMKTCGTTRMLAKELGISQPTVVRKMKKHDLSF